MPIDYSSITESERYSLDKDSLTISGKKRSSQIYWYIFLGLTVIAWPYLIYKATNYSKKHGKAETERNKLLANFADSNGFTYETFGNGRISEERFIRDLVLPFDTDHSIYHSRLKGTLLGYDFTYDLSSLFINTTNGLSQWPSIIFTLELPVTLPKMFINSKINNLPGLDAKALNFEDAKDHRLEGDFPVYYDVRIEKDEHIDMYMTLTPEVMETLKNNNLYDVWLNGKQLVFITFGDDIRYFAGTPMVINNAETLMKEIDKIARALRQQK